MAPGSVEPANGFFGRRPVPIGSLDIEFYGKPMTTVLALKRSPRYTIHRSRLRAQHAANLTSMAVMTALYQLFNDRESRKYKR
jgi:hypothetical protein